MIVHLFLLSTCTLLSVTCASIINWLWLKVVDSFFFSIDSLCMTCLFLFLFLSLTNFSTSMGERRGGCIGNSSGYISSIQHAPVCKIQPLEAICSQGKLLWFLWSSPALSILFLFTLLINKVVLIMIPFNSSYVFLIWTLLKKFAGIGNNI